MWRSPAGEVEELRRCCWQPLAGAPRDAFLRSLSCGKEALEAAEKQLTSKFEAVQGPQGVKLGAEGKLQHLAMVPSDKPLADASIAFRPLGQGENRPRRGLKGIFSRAFGWFPKISNGFS